MSVIQSLPRQARVIYTGNIFSAVFNSPTVGKYDYNIAANRDQEVIELFPGSTYLIDKIAVGGTVSEDVYNSSIDVIPEITFKRKVDKNPIYKKPFQIVKYMENSDLVAFATSEKQTDFLTMTLTGLLIQVPATVGILFVKLNVHLVIYAMDSTSYEKWFKQSGYWRGTDPTIE